MTDDEPTPADPTAPFVIVGAGGHGRELLWIVRDAGLSASFGGFVDDGTPSPEARRRLAALGAPLLGTSGDIGEPRTFVAAIGNSVARRTVAERLEAQRWIPMSVAHPDALCGEQNSLGSGVVRFPRSVVSTNVRIGRHTHLNVGVVVQHDSVIGDFVTLSPGVFVNGDVTIGDDVFVGSGAIIARGVVVGSGATIGAGAVVLRDVPAGSFVAGVPATNR